MFFLLLNGSCRIKCCINPWTWEYTFENLNYRNMTFCSDNHCSVSVSLWKWIELGVHSVTEYYISFDFSGTNVSLSETCTVHRWTIFILIQSSSHYSPFFHTAFSAWLMFFLIEVSCYVIVSHLRMFKWLLLTDYLTFSIAVHLCLNWPYQFIISQPNYLTPTHYLRPSSTSSHSHTAKPTATVLPPWNSK